MKKDQEDLLILLADQETKIEIHKSKLKEFGCLVSFVCIVKKILMLHIL